MIQTNTYKQQWETFDDDCEHDDVMTADDYDRRRYERDGWNQSQYDRQRYWYCDTLTTGTRDLDYSQDPCYS